MKNKYRVLIADDEAPARAKMQRMLSTIETVEVISLAKNGLEALEQIDQLKPDIVFLDIEMPGLTGIEVARSIGTSKVPYIVFATAYNEFAVNAFELNAIDYLLKPFNEERLLQTIEKIQAQPKGRFAEEVIKSIDKVAQEWEENSSFQFSNKIPIPTIDRYKLVDYDDVICIEVEERFTIIYTKDRTYTVSQTLDHFEKKLPTREFFRINRACIISLSKIKEIVIWFGNRFKIVLTNGKEVISSREKSKYLKQILKY
ncbi:MAG: DNA-binding response regulator [Sphingobacteriia bacterium]|jgi:DNA-binding LytR/AlgR family response regulator|nr:DNA-binding response regulator [Sphingobacteriia bacterium]